MKTYMIKFKDLEQEDLYLESEDYSIDHLTGFTVFDSGNVVTDNILYILDVSEVEEETGGVTISGFSKFSGTFPFEPSKETVSDYEAAKGIADKLLSFEGGGVITPSGWDCNITFNGVCATAHIDTSTNQFQFHRELPFND